MDKSCLGVKVSKQKSKAVKFNRLWKTLSACEVSQVPKSAWVLLKCSKCLKFLYFFFEVLEELEVLLTAPASRSLRASFFIAEVDEAEVEVPAPLVPVL